MVDGRKGLPIALRRRHGTLDVQEAEAVVAGASVVEPHKLLLHELPPVGKGGGEALTLSLNNQYLLDAILLVPANHEKVGSITTDRAPVPTLLLVATYFEFGQIIISIEVKLKLSVTYNRLKSIRKVANLKLAIELIG